MIRQRRPLGPILRFAQDEQGVVTVQNLFFTLAICAVGAIALDVTHFYAARSQLQVAADLAAHAALYTARYGNYDSTTGAHLPVSELSDVAAKDAAIASVHAGMLTNLYGLVIGRDDIILGRYNYGTGRVDSLDDPLTAGVVEYDPASVDTALVLTHRQNESAVGSFLFRIVGIGAMDVNTVAAFRLASSQDCSHK